MIKTISKVLLLLMAIVTLLTIGLGIGWLATEISNNVHDRYDVNRDGAVDVQDCLEIQRRILE